MYRSLFNGYNPPSPARSASMNFVPMVGRSVGCCCRKPVTVVSAVGGLLFGVFCVNELIPLLGEYDMHDVMSATFFVSYDLAPFDQSL